MTAVEAARRFSYFRALQRNLRLYETMYGDVCGLSTLRRHVIEEMRKLAKLMRYGVPALALVLLTSAAMAQHDHAQNHASYKSWYNKVDRNCCSDQDCGKLDESDERVTAAGTVEVHIEGVWCPVLPFHYLKKGNAPDWSTSHVCVEKQVVPGQKSVCVRLLCYQPKPGT